MALKLTFKTCLNINTILKDLVDKMKNLTRGVCREFNKDYFGKKTKKIGPVVNSKL